MYVLLALNDFLLFYFMFGLLCGGPRLIWTFCTRSLFYFAFFLFFCSSFACLRLGTNERTSVEEAAADQDHFVVSRKLKIKTIYEQTQQREKKQWTTAAATTDTLMHISTFICVSFFMLCLNAENILPIMLLDDLLSAAKFQIQMTERNTPKY